MPSVTIIKKDKTLKITQVSRLKHADLWAAAKKLGGQCYLARAIGHSDQDIGRWCNLQSCPPVSEDELPRRSPWTKELIEKLEKDLFSLTGKLLDELFPKGLREQCRRGVKPQPLEVTKEVRFSEMGIDYAERMTLPCPSEYAYQQEVKEKVQNALETLKYRDREILKLRFGLDGSFPMSLDEVSYVFRVTKERVRQVEMKALRVLRDTQETTGLAALNTQPKERDHD